MKVSRRFYRVFLKFRCGTAGTFPPSSGGGDHFIRSRRTIPSEALLANELEFRQDVGTHTGMAAWSPQRLQGRWETGRIPGVAASRQPQAVFRGAVGVVLWVVSKPPPGAVSLGVPRVFARDHGSPGRQVRQGPGTSFLLKGWELRVRADRLGNRWRFENRHVRRKADSRQECRPHQRSRPRRRGDGERGRWGDREAT